MTNLKVAHACCIRFVRLNKNLKDLSDDLKNLECGCMNCHRRDPQGEYSCATPYPLNFRRHPRHLLIKRRGFRFVEVNDASEDMVTLCLECSEFLSNHDQKVGKSFENVWPSFVWNMLMDRDMLDVYGDHMWIFVPEKWRYWWIESVRECEILESLTMDWPPAIYINFMHANACTTFLPFYQIT